MKIGDLVRLKSGGPQMTVSLIVNKPAFYPVDVVQQYALDNYPEFVTCKWWDEKEKKFLSENFGKDALEIEVKQ